MPCSLAARQPRCGESQVAEGDVHEDPVMQVAQIIRVERPQPQTLGDEFDGRALGPAQPAG